MKKLLLLKTLILLAFLQANAQLLSYDTNLVLNTKGSQIRSNRFQNIKGTPYLVDKWQNGTIKIENDKIHQLNNFKFNAFYNQIEYELSGEVYTPINSYHEFTLFDVDDNGKMKPRNFKNGFPLYDKADTLTFYEVIYSGKVQFLQKNGIRIDEYSEPLSYDKIKRFTRFTNLYLYFPSSNQIIKIKKDKNTVLDAFGNKTKSLESFIAEKKLKLKTEDEIKMLCAYFDGL